MTKNLRFSELRKRPEKIRNVGVIAHVDHGKTTLCDHLLAYAGLMASSLAGEARTLDFLPDEQERGITIESSIISFELTHNDSSFFINLIDTPGHVDFSGKVAEALFTVDGALVVIDAVEGVMPQTETVLKQALNEKITPVVMINKIDRLLTQLQLREKEMQTLLQNLIDQLNGIIFEHARNEFRLSFAKGNILLGSALDGWGIDVEDMKNGITMSTIRKHYDQNDVISLKKKLPLAPRIARLIVQHIPSPLERQRVLAKTNYSSFPDEIRNAIKSCDKSAPFIGLIGKIHEIHHFRFVNIVRILTGTLSVGDHFKDQTTQKIHRVDSLALLQGNKEVTIKQAFAGEVIALTTKHLSSPGETITTPQLSLTLNKTVEYIQEPIMTISVEPENIKHINRMTKYLEALAQALPNLEVEINSETGEIQIFGVGELQLELVLKRLKDEGISVYASPPQILLYEMPQNEVETSYTSPFDITMTGKLVPYQEKETITPQSSKYVSLYNDKRNNYLFVSKEIDLQNPNRSEGLSEGFRLAVSFGPLQKRRVRNVVFFLNSISEEREHTFEDYLISSRGLINHALKQADVRIFEPVYEFQVTSPVQWLGDVLTCIERNNGTIKHVESYPTQSIVIGYMPVSLASRLGVEIRDASEGRATITYRLAGYQPIQ